MKTSKGVLYQQGRIFWFAVSVDGIRKRFSLGTADENEATELANGIRRKYAIGLDPVQMVKENITIAELVTKYKPYSISRKAKKTSARDIVILDRFAEKLGGRNISQINQEEIEKYIASRQEGYQPATLNREITTIKSLFTKATEWKLRADNPARGIKYYKVQQKPIAWLDDADIRRILDATPAGMWRDMVIVLLETGLRLGEFVNIKSENINIKNRLINILASKTYTTRPCRITDNILPIVQKWLSEGMPDFPIGENISRKIRMIGEKLDPPLDISPHTFRHTFASRLVSNGVDIRTVQRLLGHSSVVTTMRYSHLAPNFLDDAERTGYKF